MGVDGAGGGSDGGDTEGRGDVVAVVLVEAPGVADFGAGMAKYPKDLHIAFPSRFAVKELGDVVGAEVNGLDAVDAFDGGFEIVDMFRVRHKDLIICSRSAEGESGVRFRFLNLRRIWASCNPCRLQKRKAVQSRSLRSRQLVVNNCRSGCDDGFHLVKRRRRFKPPNEFAVTLQGLPLVVRKCRANNAKIARHGASEKETMVLGVVGDQR